MPDRICPAPDCTEIIPWRRGNPAKLCPTHLSVGTCMNCGAETRRAPGVTRGALPKYCDKRCWYAAREARRTPEQVEHKRKMAREASRFDMFCLDCGDLIPRRTSGARRDVRCSACKTLHRTAQVIRKDRNKKFRQYGITADRYDEILTAQKGRCAFCGTTRAHPTNDHDFYVDHDHSCCPGKGRSCGRCVRFLLCTGCNVGLGMFRDNPAVLRAAADALDRHKSLSASAEGRLLREGITHA